MGNSSCERMFVRFLLLGIGPTKNRLLSLQYECIDNEMRFPKMAHQTQMPATIKGLLCFYSMVFFSSWYSIEFEVSFSQTNYYMTMHMAIIKIDVLFFTHICN